MFDGEETTYVGCMVDCHKESTTAAPASPVENTTSVVEGNTDESTTEVTATEESETLESSSVEY